MNDNLVPIIIVPVIFFAFVAMVKIISDNLIRRRLIEKGMVDEKVKYLADLSGSGKNMSSIKWGITLIAIGSAFIIPQFFYRVSDEVTVGLMFIFAGLGFLIYYFIAKGQSRASSEEQ